MKKDISSAHKLLFKQHMKWLDLHSQDKIYLKQIKGNVRTFMDTQLSLDVDGKQR